LPALQIGFELGGRAITAGGHPLPQTFAVLGQLKDVRVSALGRHRIALSDGRARRCAGRGRGKCPANEVAPTGLAFSEDLPDALTV